MIIDINRNDTSHEFYFKNSLRRFILVDYDDSLYSSLFIDLDNHVAYNWDNLDYEDLEFYTKEEDEDFKGVSTDWEDN